MYHLPPGSDGLIIKILGIWLHAFSGTLRQWEMECCLPPSILKFSVNVPFYSKSPLNVPFLYMKINTLEEPIKIKSTTLLLT